VKGGNASRSNGEGEEQRINGTTVHIGGKREINMKESRTTENLQCRDREGASRDPKYGSKGAARAPWETRLGPFICLPGVGGLQAHTGNVKKQIC